MLRSAAPWAAAAVAHAAVAAAVVLAPPWRAEQSAEPPALTVTLVMSEPETAPPSPAQDETPDAEAPTETGRSYDFAPSLRSLARERTLLTAPDNAVAAPAIPDSVRDALNGAFGCALASAFEETRGDCPSTLDFSGARQAAVDPRSAYEATGNASWLGRSVDGVMQRMALRRDRLNATGPVEDWRLANANGTVERVRDWRVSGAGEMRERLPASNPDPAFGD